MFSTVLCTTIVHSYKHIHMSSSYRYRSACCVGLPLAGFNPLVGSTWWNWILFWWLANYSPSVL